MTKTPEEFMKGCEHDGSFVPVNEVIRLMKGFAKQEITNLQSEVDRKDKLLILLAESTIVPNLYRKKIKQELNTKK